MFFERISDDEVIWLRRFYAGQASFRGLLFSVAVAKIFNSCPCSGKGGHGIWDSGLFLLAHVFGEGSKRMIVQTEDLCSNCFIENTVGINFRKDQRLIVETNKICDIF